MGFTCGKSSYYYSDICAGTNGSSYVRKNFRRDDNFRDVFAQLEIVNGQHAEAMFAFRVLSANKFLFLKKE